jgi:general stress protein 26
VIRLRGVRPVSRVARRVVWAVGRRGTISAECPAMQSSTTKPTEPKDTNKKETPQDQRAHIHAMLKEFSDVMLASFERTGQQPAVRARPMHVAQLDQDDSLWFLTSSDGEAVSEARNYKGASVVAQASSRYLTLTGQLEVVNDRAKIRALWNKMDEVWFPDGPEDPRVVLLHFTPAEGEFWDNSNTKGLRYLFAAAKALATGTTPGHDPDQHGTVKM